MAENVVPDGENSHSGRRVALAIVHQDDTGPGVFAEAFAEAGFQLDTWMVSEAAVPPRPLGDYTAVAVFGGAMHADEEGLHPWLAAEKALLAGLLEDGVPLLGVCLGSQLLAEAAGGRAFRARRPEIGWHEVRLTEEGAGDPLLGFLRPEFTAFGWHSYEVDVPRHAVRLAHSEVCLQGFRLGEAAWGIQFHAEVSAPTLAGWTADYAADPDAVAIGLDPQALAERNDREIGRWNDVGREICRRFCAVAGGRQSGVT